MKTSYVLGIVALVFSLTQLSAQVMSQGNFMIGASLGFSVAESNVTLQSGVGNEKGQGPSSSQFNIAPNIGYFIVDDFALGIGMDYTYNSIQNPTEEKKDGSNLLFGPFMRYYFPVDEDIAIFLVTNFGFGNSSNTQEIAGQPQNIQSNIFAVGVGPGLTIISGSAIGLEAILKYNYARSTFDTDIAGVQTTTTTKGNQFDFSLGVQFYFGGIEKATRPGNTTPRPGF